VDCLVTPTAPTPPFKLGEKLEDPLTMYLSDILTISVNLAGVPALSLPCGFTPAGLPVGMQLIAKPFGEETLFRVGQAYEQATEWHKREPEIASGSSSLRNDNVDIVFNDIVQFAKPYLISENHKVILTHTI
jgi:hypothetical protein